MPAASVSTAGRLRNTLPVQQKPSDIQGSERLQFGRPLFMDCNVGSGSVAELHAAKSNAPFVAKADVHCAPIAAFDD